MKNELHSLQATILKRISEAATDGLVDEVTRLSPLAAKTKKLVGIVAGLESELASIKKSLSTPGHPSTQTAHPTDTAELASDPQGSRGPNSTIEVTIDWSKNGHPLAVETIAEGFGSTTMARVMERLVTVLGPEILETAATIRAKRGPLVSKDPSNDYWNPVAGKPYGSKRIKGTDYSVLTGTETDQKVSDLTALLRALKFNPDSYQIRKLNR